MKYNSKHSYRYSTIFGKFRININDAKTFLHPKKIKLYPVPYRYFFLFLFMTLLFLHFCVWIYIVFVIMDSIPSIYFLITRTIFYGLIVLFCELYFMSMFREDNTELPLFFYVFYHRISPLLIRFDILMDSLRLLFNKKTYGLKLKIKISRLSITFLRVRLYIKKCLRILVAFYKWLIFLLFYHNVLMAFFKLIYFLERTKIKVFIVDLLNIFGFEYPRYILPKAFKDYWSIPSVTVYFLRLFSKQILFLLIWIKNLLFFPWFDVVYLALTPHEVNVRRYPIINAFYEAFSTSKESLYGKLSLNPAFTSKFFYNLFTVEDVQVNNITSIFVSIHLSKVKRLFQRCCLLLGVKYNVFPFNLNIIVPQSFYRFYVSYSFYTKLNNFETTTDYINFLYFLIFKNFKFNTSKWYLNFIQTQRQHFFKYEFFRDQLFFYTTYKATGNFERDYTHDEFKSLGFDDDGLDIKIDRNDFEAAYRSFLPRELIYMGDLDYLFPDIGSYNRVTLIRKAFYESFMNDIIFLRQNIGSPYRNTIHKYMRVHWLKLISYQKMCQDDIRDYQQQLELDCLFNSMYIYHERVFKDEEVLETLADFYFKSLDLLKNFVSKITYFKFYFDSLILKMYNLDYTLLNININILNYIVRKQNAEDIYLRTLIYEFVLKRESSFLQKLISKPLFDRVVEEDLLYADYYKAFASYVEYLNFYFLQWCPNFYEDFMGNYVITSREKLRNSFLGLVNAYLLKNKVALYNFKLNTILILEGSLFLKIFSHKQQGFALLLHFNLFDFFNLLKYFFFGTLMLVRLWFKHRNHIEFIQFKEVFFYDFFLFMFLIPRYLLNLIIFLLSKLKRIFFVFITIYSFFYSTFLVLIENKAEYMFNIFLLPYLFWDYWGFNLGYPFLPIHHEKWCESHHITFDIYYNILAIPTVILWFLITFYNFMYSKYMATFPANVVQAKKDSIMATDEDDRFIEGAVFRRMHEGFINQPDYEQIIRSEILRENERDINLEDIEYEDLFESYASNGFGVADNRSLFKEEFQPLDPYRDEEELYLLYNKGLLGITEKEFDEYAAEDLFEHVLDEAWVLQNDLDTQEYYKRNYGDFFYDTPRQLSSQVEERFSFLFSKSLKYDRLLSFEVNDVEKEYMVYVDIIDIYQAMGRDVDYWTFLFVHKIDAEKKGYISPHASIFC